MSEHRNSSCLISLKEEEIDKKEGILNSEQNQRDSSEADHEALNYYTGFEVSLATQSEELLQE